MQVIIVKDKQHSLHNCHIPGTVQKALTYELILFLHHDEVDTIALTIS